MKNYTNIHGLKVTITDKEEAHYYAHEVAAKKASELGEEITELYMNGDKVEIYGIENEENLNAVENAFHHALEEATESL